MGRVLHVGHQYRYHRGYAEARRGIEAGEIGQVFRADVTATTWFRAQRYFEASPWRSTWKMSGGGVLLSQACHQVDAYLAVMGSPARVTARAFRARHVAEVEDEIIILCEWDSGARGVVVASLNDPVGADRIEWHGELGSIAAEGYELRRARLETPAQVLSDSSKEEFPELDVEWAPIDVLRTPSEWFDMILDSHRDFASAALEGRPSSCDATEATRVIEFANAAYLSAVRGEPVQVAKAAGRYAAVYRQLCDGTTAISEMGARP
ncbi:MAG: Gfo/Idh/MocA family oxidoreductase [Acidimicrobiia bacterium]|nr:Gfo/Idh/MocA family oxidoreductase [Acidimicrobiia bacterium]